MSNANGPWERKPPRFAQRYTRLLVWIVIALAITAVLLELSRLFPNALGSDIDLAYFVNCVVFLALVSAGVVMGRRFTTRETLRNAVIWVGIFALCVIGYTFRDNLEAVGTKIRGELIPSYPIASGRSITLTASEGGSFYTMGTIDGTNAMPPNISMLLNAASVSSIGTSTICPSPVRSRCSSAAVTAEVNAMPQILSPIRLGTKAGSSSVPIADAKPEAA